MAIVLKRKSHSRRLAVEQLELRALMAGLVATGEGPSATPPVIDAFTMRDSFTTNLPNWVLAGKVGPGEIVKLNGDAIPATSIDELGDFALVVPLQLSVNTLKITAESSQGALLRTTTKQITYSPTFSTAQDRLVYVDAVHGETPDSPLDGTVVINPDARVVLGILPGQHIRAMSDSGSEMYMTDRSVWDTGTHSQIRTLPFSQDIPSSGVLVSGDRIYSRNQIVNIQSNTLDAATLPIDITTGGSWSSASIPGGPTISADGKTIYAGVPTVKIDTTDLSQSPTTMTANGHFVSDMQLTPDGSQLLISSYQGSGLLSVFDTQTQTLQRVFSIADFAGEIRVSADGSTAVVGMSGNPLFGGGALRAYDLNSGIQTAVFSTPLGDNLTFTKLNEVFVSSGFADATSSRLGVEVVDLTADGQLVLRESYTLGINRYTQGYGRPVNDQIAGIFHKAAPLLKVSIDPSSMSELGGTLLATVQRLDADLSQPLTFVPSSSDTSEAIVPATVTVPAGQASVTFPITAVDDALLDGSQLVTISIAASGYAHNDALITVEDHENLTVTLASSSISERGGTTTGTVTRSNVSNRHQTVLIRSNDRSEANVTAVVAIPANQSSTTFAITAVDDTLLDGSRPVIISALASGYVSGNARLVVTDYETLSLTINPTSISEQGGVATATLTRSNTNTAASRVVRLTSSDLSEARVPSTITIPADQASVTFPITAVDDVLADGNQPVTITASSVGYVSGTAGLTIADNELGIASRPQRAIGESEAQLSPFLNSPDFSHAVGTNGSWQNANIHEDVNGDNIVSALDALLVINSLNALGNTRSDSKLPSVRPMDRPLFDVDGNSCLTALDALIVINSLNAQATDNGLNTSAAAEADSFFEQFDTSVAMSRVSQGEEKLQAFKRKEKSKHIDTYAWG